MTEILPRSAASRRLAWSVLALLLVSGPPAQWAIGQESDAPELNRPLTLQECIEIALRNQPAIAAQRSAVGIAVEQQQIAKSYFFPQVNLTSRLTHMDQHRSVDIASQTLPSAAAPIPRG